MKHILLIIIMIINSFVTFPNTGGITDVTIGKIKVSYTSSCKEDNFKFECIAEICNEYLQKANNRFKYKFLPNINLHLNYSNQEKIVIGLTDKRIQLTIYSISGLTEKSLKLLDYSVINYKLLKTLNQHALKLDNDSYNLVDSLTIKKIVDNPTNSKMKECLSKTYFRSRYNLYPMTTCSKFDEVYSFKCDTFYISCNNRYILRLINIEYALISYELGFLIFDTDSSFYHFNPSDFYRMRDCGVLSARHEIKGIRQMTSGFKIENIDLINNRICFKYSTYDIDRESFLGKNYTGFSIDKRFMYLISEDLLISDYQILEQKLIDEYKMHNR